MIQELQNTLARKIISGRVEPVATQEDQRPFQKLVTDLEKRADSNLRRQLSAEDRLAKAKDDLEKSKHAIIMLERKLDDALAELTTLHQMLENQNLTTVSSFASARTNRHSGLPARLGFVIHRIPDSMIWSPDGPEAL